MMMTTLVLVSLRVPCRSTCGPPTHRLLDGSAICVLKKTSCASPAIRHRPYDEHLSPVPGAWSATGVARCSDEGHTVSKVPAFTLGGYCT